MRLKIAACLLPLAFTLNMVYAQQSFKRDLRVNSISTVGLLSGSKGSALSLQTILGMRLNRSFAGIGIGLDHYRFRSIPVFADIRHEITKGDRSMFFYGDIGYNYDWLTDKNRSDAGFFVPVDYKGGLYYDAGIGYKFGFRRSDALLFSAGYTFKQISNLAGTGNCPIEGPCFEQKQKYVYRLERLSLKAGWRF